MEDFFGLSGRPFAAAPRIDRYFPAASIEAARTTLVRAVERSEGPAIVIGPVGTGKTLLLRLLAEQFAAACRVATLAAGRIHSRRTLWQALLYELSLPYRGMDDGELRLAVVGHLTGPQASGKHILLLVDEAHALTPRLLDELRALTDLTRDGQPAAHLLLAGGPSLEEHFAHPKLEAFAQRLAARCYLEPYSREDTVAFIHAQVAACESSADALFHEEAFDAVHRATDGVPRLINQVCDHALVLAYADGLTDISPELIEIAWADLQQLPAPWSVPEPMSARRAGGAIEFGRLEDEEDTAFEPDEIPSVRFPTERIDRPATGDAAIARASLDLSGDAIGGDSFDEVDEFAVHSPDDEILEPAGDYEAADAGTEIEITIAAAAVDPFAEPFAEEVAVVDRVAAIESTRPNKKPVTPPPRPTRRPVSANATPAVADSTSVPTQSPNVAVAASAPSQPSPSPWPSANPAALHPAASVGAPRDFAPKKPRKYSQLFSQLRRNSG
jgi:type II secretory pathway predicted ATPase ExeA